MAENLDKILAANWADWKESKRAALSVVRWAEQLADKKAGCWVAPMGM